MVLINLLQYSPSSSPYLGPSGQQDTLLDEHPDLSGSPKDMALDCALSGDSEDSGSSSFGCPTDNIDNLWSGASIHLDDLKTSAAFVRELQQATLGNTTQGLSCKGLDHLQNPLHGHPSTSVNEDACLAIDLYLGTPSKAMYETVHVAILHHGPGIDLPSYYKAKRLVTDLSSIEPLIHDMCMNSCIAYTRPFLELESCLVCSQPQHN